MTNDIKLECKVKLVYSLYYKGEIDLKEELYNPLKILKKL